MLCKCHWIVLYTVHFTAFCLGGPFFPGHGVYDAYMCTIASKDSIITEDYFTCYV